MSSILNSISSGLQVLSVPREIPEKEDLVSRLLQNSEIECITCSKPNNNLQELNTGFGSNNDLHFTTKCNTKPLLKTPLYQENFLREFKTEEEKAAARHALGMYNKGDVVAMSLLTTEESNPSNNMLLEAPIKQMKQGDKFFAPITIIDAVYDSQGKTLKQTLTQINSSIEKINNISEGSSIKSLGDVGVFLNGFTKTDSLKNIVDEINQEMLRFVEDTQINL